MYSHGNAPVQPSSRPIHTTLVVQPAYTCFVPHPNTVPAASSEPQQPQQPTSAFDFMDHCQKICADMDHTNPDQDVADFNPAFVGYDEDSPVIRLHQYPSMPQSSTTDYTQHQSPPFSDAPFSTANAGTSATFAPPDFGRYGEFPSGTDIHPYATYYGHGWAPIDHSSLLQSPLTSPQQVNAVHVVSRGDLAANPHTRQHSFVSPLPYTLESDDMKRWSTTSHAAAGPSRTQGLGMLQGQDDLTNYEQLTDSRNHHHHHYQPIPFTTSPSGMQDPDSHQHLLSPTLRPPTSAQPRSSSSPKWPGGLRPPLSPAAHSLLSSNDDQDPSCPSSPTEPSGPPNLYASLKNGHSTPPESDMHPSDASIKPQDQEVRFQGDLYTPRWVRGHGSKREGWCGLCKPGRWLVLKNSAYWYDKMFTHGVSASTGVAFKAPESFRCADATSNMWEGCCGHCGEWVALVSSKKKDTTWFRHAYKCHVHPKARDGPLRRRDASSPHNAGYAAGFNSLPP